jgi:hypothetical protein
MSGSPDRPIASNDEDVLARHDFAVGLAGQLQQISQHGAVAALTGPWGTGKTSLLNLVKLALEEDGVTVVRFNPWMFSGTDELLERFFEALLSALGESKRTSNLREKLRGYADAVTPLGPLPLIGPWIQRAGLATKALTSLGGRAEARDVTTTRAQLDVALRELTVPMVVLIDDIDRLTAVEVAAVLRLVRLVADFPMIAYLLAFDEDRVHAALKANHEPQPERYLEKIVQVVHVLPPAREADLALELARGLDELLRPHPSPMSMSDTHRLDVQNLIVRPLMVSLRSVRRYLLGLPLTLDLVGKEVAPIDACALESVRLLAPGTHRLIVAAPEALTNPPRAPAARAAMQDRLRAIDEAATAAGIAPLLRLLFPAGRALLDESVDPDDVQRAAWREQHRVADRIVLDTFLLRALPAGVTPAPDLQALSDSTNPDRIAAVFDALPADALPDALRRLPSLLSAQDADRVMDVLGVLAGPVRERWRAEALYVKETDDVLERAVAAVVASQSVKELEITLINGADRFDPEAFEWLVLLLSEDPVDGQCLLPDPSIQRIRASRGWRA